MSRLLKKSKKTPEDVGAVTGSSLHETPSGISSDLEKHLLPMLEQLTRGDFTPFSNEITTALEKQVDMLRENVANTVGRSQKMADELQEKTVETTKFSETLYNDALAFDAEDDIRKSNDVIQSLSNISASAEQVSSSVNAIAERTNGLSGDVETIETTTSELTSASEEIATSTEKASGISKKAVTDVELAVKQFRELESAAAEISKVTNTISEVSDQTKLLALNATIEAARAGDAGRGFAVVASEVKELALQTNDANRDIKQKIDIIQTSINTAISSISSVSTVISEVNEVVSTIAAAAHQQSLATGDISRNIGSITNGITETKSAVSESINAFDEMNNNLSTAADNSKGLTELITRFSDEQKALAAAAAASFSDMSVLESRGEDLLSELSSIAMDGKNLDLDTSSGLFRFGPKWSVLVDDMDDQHSKIFDYANDIHSQLKAGKNQGQVLPTLKELARYTAEHFAIEETMMLKHSYPKFDSQKRAHTALLDALDKTISDISEGLKINLISVVVFLTNWLKEHIRNEDIQYGHHFEENGIVV